MEDGVFGRGEVEVLVVVRDREFRKDQQAFFVVRIYEDLGRRQTVGSECIDIVCLVGIDPPMDLLERRSAPVGVGGACPPQPEGLPVHLPVPVLDFELPHAETDRGAVQYPVALLEPDFCSVQIARSVVGPSPEAGHGHGEV